MIDSIFSKISCDRENGIMSLSNSFFEKIKENLLIFYLIRETILYDSL